MVGDSSRFRSAFLIGVFTLAASSSSGQELAHSSTCARLAKSSIPVYSTVEAKVMGVDSSHLKPGKEIWFKVAHAVSYPECTLETDAVVYARVISVSSKKNPDSSELSLAFDRADCSGHDKKPFSMRMIAVVGPRDEKHRLHDSAPTELHERGRQIDNTLANTNGLDIELNPGGPPNTVRPGIVVGVSDLILNPTGGPECSDELKSTKSKIQLSTGSELILAMTESQPIAPDQTIHNLRAHASPVPVHPRIIPGSSPASW